MVGAMHPRNLPPATRAVHRTMVRGDLPATNEVAPRHGTGLRSGPERATARRAARNARGIMSRAPAVEGNERVGPVGANAPRGNRQSVCQLWSQAAEQPGARNSESDFHVRRAHDAPKARRQANVARNARGIMN